MATVYLFSFAPEVSLIREALELSAFTTSVHRLDGARLQCPIAPPPRLVVLEPAPTSAPGPVVSNMRRHPVVGRAEALLVLDPAWTGMAPRLPVSDFVSRDASPAELLARAERIIGAHTAHTPTVLRQGPLTLDVDGFEVSVAGQPLPLTPQEFGLLKFLMMHPGKAHGRETLLHQVWGRSYAGGERTVDIHVRRLRMKLGAQGASHLRTIRGVGYKWHSP